MARLTSMVVWSTLSAAAGNESAIMACSDSKFHSMPGQRCLRVFPGSICPFFAKPAALTEGIGVQLWRLFIMTTLIQDRYRIDSDSRKSFSVATLQCF